MDFSLKFSEGVTSDQIQAAQEVLMKASPGRHASCGTRERPSVALNSRSAYLQNCPTMSHPWRLRDDAAVASVLSEQVRVIIPSPDETHKPSIGNRRSSHATPSKTDASKTIRMGDREIELGDPANRRQIASRLERSSTLG